MLTHEDALLILDHVCHVRESAEPTPNSKIDPVRAGGEEYDCRVVVSVAGRTFEAFERVLEPFCDPFGGMSRACFEGACSCEEDCPVDENGQVEIAFEWMTYDIAFHMVDDATSSSHRALTYHQLLKHARDRVARLSEIPEHIELEAAA